MEGQSLVMEGVWADLVVEQTAWYIGSRDDQVPSLPKDCTWDNEKTI